MSTSEFQGLPRVAQPAKADENLSPTAVVQLSGEGTRVDLDRHAELIDTCVICTDLDGTVLRSDSLWESLLLLIKSRPAMLFLIPVWLFQGKTRFKCELARRTCLDPANLPYCEDVLDFLRKQKDSGREIVLATGSNRKIAERISEHLHLFSAVLASDERVNLVGQAKLAALRELLGQREFDYVGNGRADLALWRAARRSFVVTPSQRLVAKVERLGTLGGVF